MSDLTLVLLAAGEASRFGKPVKKQWLRIGRDPLWLKVLENFLAMGLFKKAVVAGHPEEIAFMRRHINNENVLIVPGGNERHASLRLALEAVETPLVLVSDVARACVDRKTCQALFEALKDADCTAPALAVPDTVWYDGRPADREKMLRIQTPQLSRTEKLREALNRVKNPTDESTAIHKMGGKVTFIEGTAALHKLTYPHDIAHLPCLAPPDSAARFIGSGFDVHAFTEAVQNRPMVLGGIKIDTPLAFKAHSDGDVAVHALIDALLGAAGMGDIGELFPDTDAKWAGADSAELLRRVVRLLTHTGFEIEHADITVIAQTPRLGPYKEAIRRRLAELLNLPPQHMNVKATTTEKLGFVGRKEGVAVEAVATLKFIDWTQS